jgi:hypothetical protein
MMAYDPRVPADHQKFRFELANLGGAAQAEWILDGRSLGLTAGPRYLWPLEKGPHRLSVILRDDGGTPLKTIDPVPFTVR